VVHVGVLAVLGAAQRWLAGVPRDSVCMHGLSCQLDLWEATRLTRCGMDAGSPVMMTLARSPDLGAHENLCCRTKDTLGQRVPRTVKYEPDQVRPTRRIECKGADGRDALHNGPKTVVKSTSAFVCFGTNRLSANRPGALSRLFFSRKGAKIICSPG